MNIETNVVIWTNTGPSGALSVHVLNVDGTNTFTYNATSSDIFVQIRQAGTYYLDNIRMYRTYEDTIFVSGYEVDRAYRYGFNGMERDNEIKGQGNSYDFGARLYDSRLGRWLSIDPLASKYTGLSPYNFVANTPIQAIDPDGQYIIFINGYNVGDLVVGAVIPGWSTGIKDPNARRVLDFAENAYDFSNTNGREGVDYWKGFDVGAMNRWNDYKAQYVDGSPSYLIQDIDDNFRIEAGRVQGMNDAKGVLYNLDEGETIKIVTHSMGGAFGRGYVEGLYKGLVEEVEKHNKMVNWKKHLNETLGLDIPIPDYKTVPEIELVVDIAPWSGNTKEGYQAVHSKTFQMSGDNDGISGNVIWPGAEEVPTKKGTGHSIEEYNANDLPKSKSSY